MEPSDQDRFQWLDKALTVAVLLLKIVLHLLG